MLALPRTDATANDIKRAYRTSAARVHPDRNPDDPESTSKFQEVQYAYSVLSDEQRRAIYDTYGSQGLNMYESYMSFASNSEGSGGNGPPLPLANPALLITSACIIFGLLVALATALSVTVYLKLQLGASAPPLSAMLIPLWLLNAFALIGLYIYLGLSRSRGLPSGHAALLLVQLLVTIAFELLLVLRVDAIAPTLSFAVVLAPLYLLTLIGASKAAVRLRVEAYEDARRDGGTLLPYGLYAIQIVAGALARVAFLLLLTLQLEGTIKASWALVLLPLWAYLGLALCLACASATSKAAGEREQVALVFARGRVVLLVLLGLLLLFTTLALDGALQTWLPVFAFFFLLSGCFFCCCCCAFCAIRAAPAAAAREVPPRDETRRAATSPSEDSPLLAGDGGRAGSAPYRSSDDEPV